MSKRAVRRQLEADRAASFHDARNLVAEIARVQTPAAVDPLQAGLVLNHSETIRRMVGMWLRVAMTTGTWSFPRWTQVFITDQRLILRPQGGGVNYLYWGRLAGFEADLAAGHVVFDFGAGEMTVLSGTGAAVLAVAGIYILYGGQGLRDHPALQPIRDTEYRSRF